MRTSLIGLAVISLAAAAVPGAARADDERQAQTITIRDIPDLLVGQTAQVIAESTSELPVIVEINNGPCTLQPVAGGSPVLVATGAGDCLIWASQPGNEQFEPAADVGRVVTFVASEADVRTVIPGEDWIDAGQPLRVFAEVSGEIGDDPVPSGTVVFTVKQSNGVVADVREDDLDPQGEALAEFPGTSTATWPEGLYYVYAEYRGDEGYHPAMAAPHPLFVQPAVGPEDATPNGLISVTPRGVNAGQKVTIDLQGLPSGAQGSVAYTVVDPRRPGDPIMKTVSISGGAAEFRFSAGDPGSGANFLVNARYLYYDDDLTYRGTVVQSFFVRPTYPAMIDVLPPNGRPVIDVTTSSDGPVTLDVRVISNPGIVPGISLNSRERCSSTVESSRGSTVIRYRITVQEECRVTLSVPESIDWLANSRVFTIKVTRKQAPCPTASSDGSCDRRTITRMNRPAW